MTRWPDEARRLDRVIARRQHQGDSSNDDRTNSEDSARGGAPDEGTAVCRPLPL
jgi:hypothetical protein